MSPGSSVGAHNALERGAHRDADVHGERSAGPDGRFTVTERRREHPEELRCRRHHNVDARALLSGLASQVFH